MSVQVGVWNLDGEPVDREFLARIGKSIAEYGPDGEFSYIGGSLGMLYRPFHTTSESRVERQPYRSPKGHVVTWDGRLDNRDELMAQLGSDLGPDHTDVGIVAAAFDRWDTDCFSRLIGEWALSVWDSTERRLILARDYIGTRHVFYYPSSKRVFWCNHLAPIALCGDSFSLCDEYVAGFLALFPDAHLTPYREIDSVPPGAFVRISDKGVSVHPYWTFNAKHKTRYQTDAEYEENFRCLFRQAIRRRLRADSPILADLSGGFDSSSIVCMADDIIAKEGADTPRLDTLSVYDLTEPDGDDFGYFTEVEKRRGRVGFHVDMGKSDGAFSLEPSEFVATPGLGEREELRAAQRTIKQQSDYRVALSGLGGDEIIGQALDPRVQFADLLLQFRMSELARQLIAWSLLIRRPWIQLLLQALPLFFPAALRARFTARSKPEPWISDEFARKHCFPIRKLAAREASHHWRPSAEDSAETLAALACQMTLARPSLLEKRCPYLDQTLVEFLTSIPTEQLLRPGERRSLMRRALVGILPQEILSRRTKAGAGRCNVVTLEKRWSTVESLLRAPFISRLGYVNRERFFSALLLAKNGQMPCNFVILLRALSLEVWLRDVVTRGVLTIELEAPFTSFGQSRRDHLAEKAPAKWTLFASKSVDSSTRKEANTHDVQQT
jgi:asparagine synthase (glutamine-hydrolysing)